MFSHIFVGVNDFDRALAFYRALMPVLGVKERFCETERPWAGWQSHPEPRPLFLIGRPYDTQTHEVGNGQMVALLASTRAIVDQAYAVALAHGGTSEGPPGVRPEYHANYYGAYFRDTEGNKLCVVCHSAASQAPGSEQILGDADVVASAEFAGFLKELLAPLGHASCRRMFGKTGVFVDGVMLGMVRDNVLYLRVDEHSPEFFREAAASPPLNYEKGGQEIDLAFWRLPDRLLDEPHEFVQWARAGLEAARRVAAKSAKRSKARSSAGRQE